MARLSQADLLADLNRHTGTLLEQTLLELLSRGKSAIRQVVARLDEGLLDVALSEALERHGRRVLEMLASSKFLAEPNAPIILSRIPNETIASKIPEFFERGDHSDAEVLAAYLQEQSPEDPVAFELHTKLALIRHEWESALRYLAEALERGADPHIVFLVAGAFLDNDDLAGACESLNHAVAYSEVFSTTGHQMSALIARALSLAAHAPDENTAELLQSCMSAIDAAVLSAGVTQAIEITTEYARKRLLELSRSLGSFSAMFEELLSVAQEAMNENVPLRLLAEDAIVNAQRLLDDLERTISRARHTSRNGDRVKPSEHAAILNAEFASLSVMAGQDGFVPSVLEALADLLDRALEEKLGFARNALETVQTRAESVIESLRDVERDGLTRIGFIDLLKEVALFGHIVLVDTENWLMLKAKDPEITFTAPKDTLQRAVELAKRRTQAQNISFVLEVAPSVPATRLDGERLLLALVSALRRAAIICDSPGRVDVRLGRTEDHCTHIAIATKASRTFGDAGLATVKAVCDENDWVFSNSNDGGECVVGLTFAPDKVVDSWSEIPGYASWMDETRQAVRAADALLESGNAADTALFLYGRAADSEIEAGLFGFFERHRVLPTAIAIQNDNTQKINEIAGALDAPPREVGRRLDALASAVIKNRTRRELGDWRSLAVALAAFYPDTFDAELSQTLYRAGDTRAKSEPDEQTVLRFRSEAMRLFSLLEAAPKP